MGLVQDITIYCLDHSAEAEACDLLMEIEKIDMIDDLVSEDTHDRVCLYLTRSHSVKFNEYSVLSLEVVY